MESITNHIKARLYQRELDNALRVLRPPASLVDFCSNDYLGFASSARLKEMVLAGLDANPGYTTGSTGSRLISGNDTFTEDLEQQIADFHQEEAGLIFNSGYAANVGLFSSLAQRGDTIITDELIHASVIDGARMSHANKYIFKHNDPGSLEEKLKVAKGRIYIAVESVYSMDGDEAPLNEIAELAEKYGAGLIVDEAHAVGIKGPGGRGCVNLHGLQNTALARVITFGKALGCHGAIVVGSRALRSYLINFARSFVYSTAAAFYTHLSVKMAYQYLQETDHQVSIEKKISLFQALSRHLPVAISDSQSAIQGIITCGNERTKGLSLKLASHGFDVRAILHPTVPAGKERLRVCLHTFNSDEEISGLINTLQNHL
ncbi:aminotransferase class I/II-fold pyridoxal phosphate-dependent enzyme [Hufsiella ginkgonis]|uniref:aminotransferase class I/II-fold pyridoxal phosphate-dependent enzyme n=1 Tax=Hufsiella ginkgonis TaxID=2695274 RepID=UPI001F2590B5|nr:8-amino-7-oxononanoate synthase [Hufsiella ginkgonis]